MAITLRPYQVEAVLAVLGEWARGIRRTLLVMATGCGKSETFFGVLHEERKRCVEEGQPFRALIIAHTTELVEGPRNRIARDWRGKLPVPGIVQASTNECNAEIVVASIQTLSPNRLSTRFPTFARTTGEQKFIEADSADDHLPLFDEFGDPIKVQVPKTYEDAVKAERCKYLYTNNVPVMTGDFEKATLENYRPYAGHFEPMFDGGTVIGVEAIPTKRRLKVELEPNLGYWKFIYEDTGKPYIIPDVKPKPKSHPVRLFNRLREILEHGPITHLVIDEAHHAPADSYREVLRALEAVNPNLRTLGVTATPDRSDERKMASVFGSVAYRIDLFKAIYLMSPPPLCRYKREAAVLPVDAQHVLTANRKEFTKTELSAYGEVMSAPDALEIMVDTWEDMAKDRRSIFFTASVNHARQLCDTFQRRGYNAEFLDGDTPKGKEPGQRGYIVDQFRSGEVQIICNCDVLSEGVNIPEISFVGMAGATKSKIKYAQRAGRGLRNHPTKDRLNPPCLIVDFTPQDSPKDLRTSKDILGTNADQLRQIREAKEEGDIDLAILNELEQNIIQGEIAEILEDRERAEVTILPFDFFQAESPLDWEVDNTIATAAIARGHILAVVSPQLDRLETAQELIKSGNWKPEWDAHLDHLRSYQLYAVNGGLEKINEYSDWEDARKAAQVYADEYTDEYIGHSASDWRDRKPSGRQIQRAREAGVEKPGQFERMGDLSKAISHVEAQTALRKAKVIK